MPPRPRTPRRLRRRRRPPLTASRVLTWADSHHARTGTWPKKDSGPVVDDPNETWLAIDSALREGQRGLRGGSSLARLLASERALRNSQDLPPFTDPQILAWADRHHARTGTWPGKGSGPVLDDPDETWLAIDAALYAGARGLPGGSSLARLLE